MSTLFSDVRNMSAGAVTTMPPPARRSGQKRQREQTLLEEDEWTDRIEAIIQRDFFPDLPKLQNKLEWLQVRGCARLLRAAYSRNMCS